MAWLLNQGLDLVGSLRSGFTPQRLAFGDHGELVTMVTTTALLAEGGFSYVYLAREAATGQQYAVKKVLAQDDETRQLAETEAALLRRLSGHDSFVRCHGTLTRPGKNGATEHWFLLDFCPNGSLIDLLYRKGADGEWSERGPPLTQERVLEVFECVACGVAHLHSLSPPVAHRDLKLENALCREDGRTYVLCDFGSATSHVLPAHRTRRELLDEEERIARYSTQMYRAPEMLDLYREHEVGLAVDVWALGCILFALCFREHPFPAESSLQILNANYAIPANSCYSEGLHDFIHAMLTPDPALRPSAAEMLERTRRMRSRPRHPTRPRPQVPPASEAKAASATAAEACTTSRAATTSAAAKAARAAGSDASADGVTAAPCAATPASPLPASTAKAAAAAPSHGSTPPDAAPPDDACAYASYASPSDAPPSEVAFPPQSAVDSDHILTQPLHAVVKLTTAAPGAIDGRLPAVHPSFDLAAWRATIAKLEDKERQLRQAERSLFQRKGPIRASMRA